MTKAPLKQCPVLYSLFPLHSNFAIVCVTIDKNRNSSGNAIIEYTVKLQLQLFSNLTLPWVTRLHSIMLRFPCRYPTLQFTQAWIHWVKCSTSAPPLIATCFWLSNASLFWCSVFFPPFAVVFFLHPFSVLSVAAFTWFPAQSGFFASFSPGHTHRQTRWFTFHHTNHTLEETGTTVEILVNVIVLSCKYKITWVFTPSKH